jgi:hypothetical protein
MVAGGKEKENGEVKGGDDMKLSDVGVLLK